MFGVAALIFGKVLLVHPWEFQYFLSRDSERMQCTTVQLNPIFPSHLAASVGVSVRSCLLLVVCSFNLFFFCAVLSLAGYRWLGVAGWASLAGCRWLGVAWPARAGSLKIDLLEGLLRQRVREAEALADNFAAEVSAATTADTSAAVAGTSAAAGLTGVRAVEDALVAELRAVLADYPDQVC